MSEAIVDLLRGVTVQILDSEGELRGSGFFIAPGQVLTAAHVLERFRSGSVWVRWQSRQPAPAVVEWAQPSQSTPGIGVYPLPDLAVLRVPAAEEYDHPCAMLSETIVGTELAAEGFTRGVTVPQPSSDPVRVTYEGIIQEPGGDLIKCKDAEVREGMSGGPLLDLSTGLVVGVVKAQRAPDWSAGLYAAHVNGLLQYRPDLWATCHRVHQIDRRWPQAIRPGATVSDPRQAAQDILSATVRAVRGRVWNLPPHVDRAALHQTIWVQRVGRVTGQREPVRNGTRPVAESFRWRPLRDAGRTVIICGLPGHGKSWLLAYHAESIAKDSQSVLDSGQDPTRVRLPILADCAALAVGLRPIPDRDEVVSALLRAAGLGTGEAATSPTMIMAKDAFEDGRLVICLDAFDEIPVQLRPRAQKALGLIAAGQCSLLVATRHTTLNLLDDLPAESRVDIETLGFTAREASRFATVWLDRDPERHAALSSALEASPPLRDLASVPLLLSFLCRLAGDKDRSGALPTSKSLLYQEVMAGLLAGKWRSSGGRLDPEYISEPQLRLRVLADSLGALLDAWRSSGNTVSRAALAAQMAEHPDYERLRSSAVARWNGWQRANDAEPGDPPAEPVLWEFTFDGLLVYGSESNTIQVLHPSLRDFLLASYLANLEESALQAALDRHRWFDADWQEIFAVAAPLMIDPNRLIRYIIAVSGDPWLSQALFAARCVAEAGGKVSDETTRQVIQALLDRATLVHPSDMRRGAEGLAALVLAKAAPAVVRALEICETDAAPENKTVHRELFLTAVSVLAEIGHERGVLLSIDLVRSARIPQRHRARLITSLTATNNEAAHEAVFNRLKSGGRQGDLDAFLAAVKPHSTQAHDTAVRLLRTRSFAFTARAAVAATLIECGDAGIAAVRQASNDETMERGFRCRLAALLINADVPGAIEEAIGLMRNPNVELIDKSYVIEAMLRSSEFIALPSAAELILDSRLDWRRREALASAICDIGADGSRLLREQLIAGLPLNLTVRHMVALAEVGDRTGLQVAAQVSQQEGVPAWIRAVLLLVMFRGEPDAATIAAAIQVAGDGSVDFGYRTRLTVSLIKAGAPGGMDALRIILEHGARNSQWSQTSRMLAASGPTGQRALTEIAADSVFSWNIRTEAVLALAGSATQEEVVTTAYGHAAASGIPDVWRDRLILGLADAGYAQFAAMVISFLPTLSGAYEILHKYMRRPNASMDIYFDHLAALSSAMSTMPKSGRKVVIDDEMLRSCELTWSSEGEADVLKRWFYGALEFRVGTLLANLMLPDQLTEFEKFIDHKNEDDALEWLNSNFPIYGSFVHEELDTLREEIRSGDLIPPRPNPEPTQDEHTLTVMRIVLAQISELAGRAEVRNWPDFFKFLEHNKGTLLTRHCDLLLQTAALLDKSWPFHEALLFCIRHASANGVVSTQTLLTDSGVMREAQVGYFDHGNGEMLYLAGALATLIFPDTAHCQFYAALGAEMADRADLATALMRESGRLASSDQVLQGSQTIRDLTERFDWNHSRVEELVTALTEAYGQAHPTTTGDF
jgi:hypothetical protein